MKRTILATAVVVLLAAIPSLAAMKPRQITLPVGQSKVVEFGFPPASFNQRTGRDAVSVSLAEGASSAEVTALVEGGKSQIEFTNLTGDGVLLTVDVVSDLDRTLAKLEDRLSDFDDLELTKGDRKILVEGTIGTPAEWSKFNRILKLEDFAGKTESLVEYSVDNGTIAALRKEFEAAGFTLAASGARPEKGQLGLEYQHNVLTVSGTVWSRKELVEALSILKRQSWLKIVESPSEDAAFQPFVQAVGSIDVDDALLELGVAFLKVSKSAFKSAESGAGTTRKASWGGLQNIVLMGGTRNHQDGKWNNFSIDVGLDHTLSLLAGNNVVRERQYGTLRFHANGDPGKTLHLGGKLTVTPPASGEGEAPKAQDYEYGIKIVNKNSRRLSSNLAEADFLIEIKGEPYADDNGIGGTTVKQEEKTVEPTVRIPLGKTVAVAGYEHLLEMTENKGQPFIRHIPIIGWFVSDRGEKLDDDALLFLVSIRKVDVESEAPMVENTPMKDISLDVNTPNDERIRKELLEGRHRGCWTPLNWLKW